MSVAKLVRGHIEPRRIDDAAHAVESELIPRFLAHRGARHGYWMANRVTGQVLITTIWSDRGALCAAEADDGAERAEVAERVGLRILAIQCLEVFGAHEADLGEQPVARWARATWVEGVRADRMDELPLLHRASVSDQVHSRGFRGSYWLGDRDTGNGLGLSLWRGPAELSGSRRESRRRQRRFEDLLGCRVDLVTEYEAIGVAAHRSHRNPAGTRWSSARVG